MPAFFSHYRFGFYSYKEMNKTIVKQSIKNHPHVFALGCQGPDLFFYNIKGYTKVKNNYAGRLHEENTGKFFNHLLQNVLKDKLTSKDILADDDLQIQIAYAAGFLAHYCLDCKIHPFVYSRVGANKGMFYTGKHFGLESDIDKCILEKFEGRKPSDFRAPAIVALNRKERDVVAARLSRSVPEVLNNVKLSVLQCKFILKSMEFILTLLRDDSGLKGRAGDWIERKLFGYVMSSPLFFNNLYNGNKDSCNERKQPWLNPFNNRLSYSSVFEMINEAKEEYLQITDLLAAAIDNRELKDSLFDKIGNRSYKTGMEI